MRNFKTKSLWLCLCLIAIPLINNAAIAANPASSQLNEQMIQHVNVLNELSERRRINTLFKNEQSGFYGLQLGFVNTGLGNTTFRRRDLVVANRIPLSITRVYDSSLVNLTEASDFGDGWQLSLAETIQIDDDGNLLYTDDNAVSKQFIAGASGYEIYPAQNSDIKSIELTGQASIQVVYQNGWMKRFKKLGSRYRLITINDNNGNQLKLAYRQNRLSKISGANNRQLSIHRDEIGRIIHVKDDHNRVVEYGYSKKGRLKTVRDLAGNPWRYQYHRSGLLHKIIDPLNQLVAKFSFDKHHKVKTIKVRGQKYNYKYNGNTTTVKDGHDYASTFIQNDQGVTTSVTNADGFTSAIVLNARNQITELWHNQQQQSQIIYDSNGRPTHYNINGRPTAMENLVQGSYQQHIYQYDTDGRVTNLDDGFSGQWRYVYDKKGNLTLRQHGDYTVSYEYASNGDIINETQIQPGQAVKVTSNRYTLDGLLATQTQHHLTTYFDYTPVGKLMNISFPNGKKHQYSYNPLGFRASTTRSDNSAIHYVYDSLGNLNELTKVGVNQSKQTLALNVDNQLTSVVAKDGISLAVEYTKKGNPNKVVQGSKITEYQYDKLGRLIGVDDNQEGQLSYQYAIDERDIRVQLDERTATTTSHQNKITSHNQNQSELLYARLTGSPWQAVVWDEALGKFLIPLPGALNSPDAGYQSSKQRRRLYNGAATSIVTQHQFDKPSNSFFIPPEYQAANCEPPEDEPCYARVNSLIISAPTGGKVGQTITFRAKADIPRSNSCDAQYTFGFNGFTATNSTGYFNVPLTSAGKHTAVATVECCSSIKWFVLEYTVADTCSELISGLTNESGCMTLTTETEATTPANRSRRILGVGERVYLESSMYSDWTIVTGGGKLSEESDTKVTTFTAPDIASTTKIKVTAGSGSAYIEFKTIPPNGIRMQREPSSQLNHRYGLPGVGYKAQIYLQPDTVSFYRLSVYEPFDATVTLATGGYFAYEAGAIHYPYLYCCADGNYLPAHSITISGWGTLIAGNDHIQGVGASGPYSIGSAYWNIPWRYIVDDTTNAHYFSTVRQEKMIDRWGNMTVIKGGHAESANLFDPSSSW